MTALTFLSRRTSLESEVAKLPSLSRSWLVRNPDSETLMSVIGMTCEVHSVPRFLEEVSL